MAVGAQHVAFFDLLEKRRFASPSRNRHAKPSDYELMNELAEEDKDLRIKNLELELASLKGNPVEEPKTVPDSANAVPWGPPEPGELDDAELEALTAPSGASSGASYGR